MVALKVPENRENRNSMSRFEELTKAAAETNSSLEERRRADETLRNLRQIVDSIPGLVCTLSPSGELELFNRQILEYFGKTPEELRAWAGSDAIHPDDHLRVVSAFTHSITSGIPYDIEHRCRRADGVYRWFQVRALPVRGADGHIAGWYALLTDIDDRKRAEEALRATESSLRSIINTLPTPAWSTRPDGYCDFLSQRWLDYAGYSAEQAEGWSWRAVLHPDDADGITKYWQSCLASGTPVDTEARMRRFDGEYRWFLVRANPLRDEAGNIIRWYGTNVDIEDRKRADEELRRSATVLAQGQRLNSTGSFSWRMNPDEITFSDELYRIFEFERDAPVTLEQIAGRVHPEDIPLMTEKINKARADDVNQDYEIRLRMPDGSIKYLHTISQSNSRQDGRLEQIGAIQDVTQRRLSEEALAKLRSELAHVARITSLGVLTASIAHEINNPLAAIIANGETGLRWLARPEPNLGKARDLTALVVADARRASDIIDRIRAMAAQRVPKSTLLSLGEIVEESMIFLRHEFQSKRISVSLDLAPALPQVVGDRTQIQQVIVNLALNAAQALAQSEAERRSISVRTMLSDLQTVGCTIEDSGPGIDPVHLPRLFDSFFTTKDSGMGMGLPISRSIVDAHGGQIRADNDSALGGARFSFELPANGAG
jgi:PAS domain S-box-containing protein